MKTKEKAVYNYIKEKHNQDECIGFIDGYTQCQEDMLKEIQSLMDGYKSDILLLEKEFRDSSSVLTLEKIVTLQGVINNLEAKFYIKY